VWVFSVDLLLFESLVCNLSVHAVMKVETRFVISKATQNVCAVVGIVHVVIHVIIVVFSYDKVKLVDTSELCLVPW
jgi:hypothetical protein